MSSADANAMTTMADLEAVKQEILAEVKKEINKAKQEIIEGQ
jgi:VASP tetramerisation domain